MDSLSRLLEEIRSCRVCEAHLSYGVRPVLRASKTARLAIISQAPGIRVHQTGIPFNDPSGDRLRDWTGLERDRFYDESRIAIVPMGFCFPGYDPSGSDRPPRRECAKVWRKRLFDQMPDFQLTLLVGSYAQAWHLSDRVKSNMTETVKAWRSYSPAHIPLPHPSWRNSGWLKKHPWFERDLLPHLRRRVQAVLAE